MRGRGRARIFGGANRGEKAWLSEFPLKNIASAYAGGGIFRERLRGGWGVGGR